MKKHKHHGKASKSVKPEMHGKGPGSNLKMPSPSHALHVAPQKDKLAKNVGGKDHMQVDAKSLGHQDLQKSGGSYKGAKSVKDKY